MVSSVSLDSDNDNNVTIECDEESSWICMRFEKLISNIYDCLYCL